MPIINRTFHAPIYVCEACGIERASSNNPDGSRYLPRGWVAAQDGQGELKPYCPKCKREFPKDAFNSNPG